jgi:hypothetical protein
LYTLLNASKSAKSYQLATTGWVHDDAGLYDDEKNTGYIARKTWAEKSAVFQLVSPIFTDLFLQPQYMIDDIDFDLKFSLNSLEFVLQHFDGADVDYKISIEDASLWLRQVNVSPSVVMGHAAGLSKQNSIYPYNGYNIFSHTLGAGTQTIGSVNLFQGIYPKLVILGLVDEDAFCGTYKKSPFNFKHYNCNYCELSVNGNIIPHKPFTPNFKGGKIMREFLSLFWGLGKAGMLNDDNGIVLKD